MPRTSRLIHRTITPTNLLMPKEKQGPPLIHSVKPNSRPQEPSCAGIHCFRYVVRKTVMLWGDIIRVNNGCFNFLLLLEYGSDSSTLFRNVIFETLGHTGQL